MNNFLQQILGNIGGGVQNLQDYFKAPGNPYSVVSPIQNQDLVTRNLPAGVQSPVPTNQILQHVQGGSGAQNTMNQTIKPIMNQLGSNFQAKMNPASYAQPVQAQVAPKMPAEKMATPTPTPAQKKIVIPYSQTGQPFEVPQQVATVISNAFGDKATEAATVLNHPPAVSPVSGAVTYGENGSFIVDPNNPRFDTTNTDGSVDRGLFRINSNTFNDYQRFPELNQQMQKYGINSWDDMKDPQKNAYMAKMIYDRQGWNAWVAAPPELRRDN